MLMGGNEGDTDADGAGIRVIEVINSSSQPISVKTALPG
jgi:hypothetical protein